MESRRSGGSPETVEGVEGERGRTASAVGVHATMKNHSSASSSSSFSQNNSTVDMDVDVQNKQLLGTSNLHGAGAGLN
eukprot:876748-Rhodomonas_salina.1